MPKNSSFNCQTGGQETIKFVYKKLLAYDDAESGRKRQESDVIITQIPPPFSAADEAWYWPKCIVHSG